MTFSNLEEAKSIGTLLVEEQIVACFNIIPQIHSIFLWENKINHETETIAIAKLSETNFPDLSKKVEKLHSYDTPCILKLPISDGNKAFIDWIQRNCKPTHT